MSRDKERKWDQAEQGRARDTRWSVVVEKIRVPPKSTATLPVNPFKQQTKTPKAVSHILPLTGGGKRLSFPQNRRSLSVFDGETTAED